MPIQAVGIENRAERMDFRIIHHHIGARGNVPLPLDGKSPIRKDFAVYYYDADESALTDALRDLIKVGEAHLLPYCLGARRERRPFHIANDAYASSLYRLNTDYKEYTKATALGQLTIGKNMGVAREIEVDVVPLDEICGPGLDIPAPDYLSIDAEGAELDVMQGAARTLRDTVVWLRSEMWIHPVYQGARTFNTSLAFLQDAGFDLFHMEPYREYEADRMPLGMHSGGQTLGAEVDFQRRISDLLDEAETDRPTAILKLYKLAFMAILNGGNGLCFNSLKQAQALGGTFFSENGKAPPASYLEFLREVWTHMRNMSEFLPVLPDFSRYIHARRRRRFAYSTSTDGAEKQSLKDEDNAARKEVAEGYRTNLDRVHRLYWSTTSSLEGCCIKFGLRYQAEQIRLKRKLHCETFINEYYRLSESAFR